MKVGDKVVLPWPTIKLGNKGGHDTLEPNESTDNLRECEVISVSDDHFQVEGVAKTLKELNLPASFSVSFSKEVFLPGQSKYRKALKKQNEAGRVEDLWN